VERGFEVGEFVWVGVWLGMFVVFEVFDWDELFVEVVFVCGLELVLL